MARIVFRGVLFRNRRKCVVCEELRRFGCEQVGFVCLSYLRRVFSPQDMNGSRACGCRHSPNRRSLPQTA